MYQLTTKLIAVFVCMAGLLVSQVSQAEYIATENSAEANQLRIVFEDKSLQQGVLYVRGCELCPLKLNVDGQTRFFYNNKDVQRGRLNVLSGKPGTVIYSLDDKQAIRILW